MNAPPIEEAGVREIQGGMGLKSHGKIGIREEGSAKTNEIGAPLKEGGICPGTIIATTQNQRPFKALPD
jgi:hypothetical protein